jgi:hypothetical protein
MASSFSSFFSFLPFRQKPTCTTPQPAPSLPLIMASGRCTVVAPFGTFNVSCPCQRGEFEGHTLTPDAVCKMCTHSLSQHEAAPSALPQHKNTNSTLRQHEDARSTRTVGSFLPPQGMASSVPFISAMSSGAVNGHALSSADGLICRQNSFTVPWPLPLLIGPADVSQSQRLNSATTDQLHSGPPPADPYICPRTDTVEKIATLLEKKRVVHVRGTPSSGKTTLAVLLWRYYYQREEPVLFLNGWHKISDPRAHLVNRYREIGLSGIEPHTITNANFVLILDEAQQSYNDKDLWTGIIKTQSGHRAGLKICLFSSYGSPTTGADETLEGTTPPEFGPSQRISITASAESGRPCLFYNREEFEDVASRICSDPTARFELDPAAREYLYSITNGHPGATEALLNFSFEVCMSCRIC